VHAAPVTLEAVRGCARVIRRRRQVAASGAVAAVVALAVLLPAVLGRGSDPSRTPQPAPAVTIAPGASVLHDGTVTRPDGSTVDVGVDNADVQQLGVLTDGRVVVAASRPYGVAVYAADGALERTYPVAMNVITLSPADDAVAWVAEDLTVRVLASGAARPATLPGIPMPGESAGTVDAVLDAEHLLVGDGVTTTGLLTPDGVRPLRTGEPLRVTDVSPEGDLWAVGFVPAADQQYGCAGLYDPARHEVVARSCDVNGLAFAPDGRHLLSAFAENNEAGAATVVDPDLRVVGRVRPGADGDVVSRVGWADPTHVLAAVATSRGDRWSLVRTALDGTGSTLVSGPVPGRDPELTAEYLLSS
jgi:hypothetical protein